MYLNQSPEILLQVFVNNLLVTNRGFNYYVNWNNVTGYEEYMVEVYAMDILIGCPEENFKTTFVSLVSKLPNVILLFPFLFGLAKAERSNLYKGQSELVIIHDELNNEDNLKYNFAKGKGKLTDEDIEKYYDFFVNMGLKHLYQNIIEKSTLDYINGVLVGMDSNGRKNRGGQAFELACQPSFERVCKERGLILMTQTQFKKLREYGFEISDDIANRNADFIILDPSNMKAINFEVNFYNGTGSKPEEIIDSYINRQSDLEANGIDFALVTDGNCWDGSSNQLEKGFRHMDYLMNFHMFKHGMLDEIVDILFGSNDD